MAAAVIDASLASAWCFPDEQTDYTKAVFEAISSSALDVIAPRLWAYEIRNSVLMGVRRGRVSKQDGEQFLLALDEISVRLVDPESYDGVLALAHEQGLTFYDAAYLYVALREPLPLATLDNQLARAAQKVGVQMLVLT